MLVAELLLKIIRLLNWRKELGIGVALSINVLGHNDNIIS